MPLLIEDDFVPTLSDNDDISDEEAEDVVAAEDEASIQSNKRKRETSSKQGAVKKLKQAQDGETREDKDSDLESEFEFENEAAADLGDFDGWVMQENGEDRIAEIVRRKQGKNGKVADAKVAGDDDEEDEDEEVSDMSVEDGMLAEEDDEDSEADSKDSDESGDDEVKDYITAATVVDDFAAAETHPDDIASDAESGAEDEDDVEEKRRQDEFFAPEDTEPKPVTTGENSFTSMSLNRRILKNLTEQKFYAPTPIQRKAIPVAMEGKDVVGGAVTGSGKTAAFLIPIMERLLHRPKGAVTRVAILMPTRELALQCLSVAQKLALGTGITFGRAIGGLPGREQEKELKLRPDIVIATPGRFIDFMRNSPALQVDKIEILVLDEADRMLEEGFSDELNEILQTIPRSRQTMLFSATMTSKVDDLIRVGMHRPVRLLVDAQKTSATGLTQEFVRLRPGREEKRLGYLLHLCTTLYRERTIIFFRQKKTAHHVRIVFALCGLQAAELHGSMSQEQRISSMESFRAGRVNFLLATDLASRGLDIKGIETVINYEAPQSHEIYLHRVGRTARAGRKGVAVTLAAEPDRKVVKLAVKAAKAQGVGVKQRTIEPGEADRWQTKIDGLEEEIEDVMREEKEDRVMTQTERDLKKADNLVEYADEIKSRPKKTWFQSEAAKEEAKSKGAEKLNGPAVDDGGEKKKSRGGGKLSNKKRKRLEDKDERREGREWKKGKSDSAAGGERGGKGGRGGARGGKAREGGSGGGGGDGRGGRGGRGRGRGGK
ncbi:nucleolar DEAD-box protein required for synthesis of 60S ribosomal subunit [Meristemomyces frigidus]|uniref:RNA helicase n=1 Tax=Meristemomyces frigidus TaxID=1508187 RepID=A0AAN7YT28_9PEZI|nr:nucleolar DEAD-box protein required for synthesis of 60S ribosomal subunit [Meristemomyces frigidus]